MKLKHLILPALFALAAIGCDSNPTNAPTAADIKQAEQDQIKAIDNDPKMSAQDKENLKRAKGFISGGPPGSTGRDKR